MNLSGPVLISTCDNILAVYLDGIEQNIRADTTHHFSNILTMAVPPQTRVVGLKCTDREAPGGLHASVRVPLVRTPIQITDSRWVCSDLYETGWETQEFDSSQWSPAQVVEPQESAWAPYLMVWAQTKRTDTVYCRLATKLTQYQETGKRPITHSTDLNSQRCNEWCPGFRVFPMMCKKLPEFEFKVDTCLVPSCKCWNCACQTRMFCPHSYATTS